MKVISVSEFVFFLFRRSFLPAGLLALNQSHELFAQAVVFGLGL